MNKKSILAGLFLAAGFYCFAQNNTSQLKLTPDQAVQIAFKNNVSIARQQITLEGAKRAKAHSWNSISPSLSAGVTADVPLDFLTAGDQSSNYSSAIGINAAATINFTANLYTAMEGAKISYEQSKISFEEALRTVEMNVRQTFYGLLYEKENILLQEENLKIARKQYENNQTKYNNGRLSEVDAISAEVNYKSKIPVLENARTVYENDLDSFKQLLGLDPEVTIELDGSLEDMLFLETVSVNPEEACSPVLKDLEIRLASARNTVLDRRLSAYAPNLSARLSWSDQSWYSGYDGDAPAAKKKSSVSLTATVPLDGVLPWSSKNDGIDSAKDSVKDLELQLETERKNLKRNIASSLRSIKQSQESILYKQANISLAQKSFDMTSEAYNRGTKDLLTLENANTTLMNARVSLNSEILTLTKAILNLENIMGLPFDTLVKKESNK